ncbi:MAG: glycosyltransferase family 2 protein [Planctomycetaceae bacterium]
MKLIVQIPCLNEEETLQGTVRDIPRRINGIDWVEILVIDDGSTDQTVAVAREAGIDHLVQFPESRGLAHAFSAGIERSLILGADIIVNTDGDNQYAGDDISKLVQPILDGQAQIVIGDRQPAKIAHFSIVKRILQTLGSRVVSRLAGTQVPDAASGFRAYSREAALRLIRTSDFSHSVDHVIQAGRKGIAIKSVPIRTNRKRRESRLFSNIGAYIRRQLGTMLVTYSLYRLTVVFAGAGIITINFGLLAGIYAVYRSLSGEAAGGHVPSLVLSGVLLLAGFQMLLMAILAKVINCSHLVMEEALYRLRKLELRDETPRARVDERPPLRLAS